MQAPSRGPKASSGNVTLELTEILINTLHIAESAVTGALPGTTPDMRRLRLAALDDNIASIRMQTSAADLERQAKGKRIDPSWFHRAKTALPHLQHERAELLATIPAAEQMRLGNAVQSWRSGPAAYLTGNDPAYSMRGE